MEKSIILKKIVLYVNIVVSELQVEEVREILNKGSGRNKEDDKIGVMKWLIAVVFGSWLLSVATFKGSGCF